ncbi:uncharacterized protein TOT_030000393 [Theileria orientalis strain Shintoku]|uniref:E3 ubiquitin-protein ligase CHFR n=1 Tax=Theileria orientalis strain Shintoku TaxID=869250 RepID=J4D912_THEOR|nr:uncharacterized protein TOT_030000393 [Theileria orientalis strain Shintoku]BAM41130.1 uncharacterized protein TOT_030000393 [Theileria orientalis strain Shintoku]|eukprot:XP_009691431.1 uncharacterized protein TOT_030000393 [Theileria orientalis strain Shintoku]
MEQKSSHIDAKETETSNTTQNNSNESNTSPFNNHYCTRLRSYSNPNLERPKTDKHTKKPRRKNKKRTMNNRNSKIVKRRSLSPDVSATEPAAQSNTGSTSLSGRKMDSYERVTQKEGMIGVIDGLSPMPPVRAEDLNESTLCQNELTNDSNMCSDTGINGSMYSDNDLQSQNLYTETATTGSQLMSDSQMFNNTSLGVNNMDLNMPARASMVGITTNSSQGFDLLQNMHYDQNTAGQHVSNPTGFMNVVNALSEGANAINLNQMNQLSQYTEGQTNQYGDPYLLQYGSDTRAQDGDEYMQYEAMDYVDNVEYMLDDGLDYAMDSNYTQDNTNLASNNYDPNNVFINMDNATQSQDQLSVPTVSFNNALNTGEDLVMADMGTDEDKEMIRNNSINVLIENSEKKLDEGVMSSILRDLICPICLEYFYFPVTVACGHTFCRYCIGHSKLSGKVCPLCRQPIGRSLNINTILSNLVKSLKLRKRGYVAIQKAPEVSQTAEKMWWDEHCLKPFVSVPLFIRIMFGGLGQTPVFFDDLCTCLVNYFDTGRRWSKTKWVFTLEDFRLLRSLIGLQLSGSDQSQGNEGEGNALSEANEANIMRVHHWVEDYMVANPQLCFRGEVSYPLTLKVYHDLNHKIEGTIFSAMEIPYRLPWDAGRHVKSLLHLPHSSVSLSHLIFTQCANGQFGILDVGSTIGTMIKIQNSHVLKTGDRIHIGDKHEVDVHIYKDSIGTPFRDYKWDANTNQVINYTEYINSHQSTSPSEGDMSDHGGPDNAGSGDETIGAEKGANLHDLDSFLKLRIFADLQVERDVWICPKGVILGRGPVTQSSYKKLSITTQNGYISREHCLIYYDGSRPTGSRWILRDMSTLGTFLKLKPFQEPMPLAPGFVFKVGQCKVEVGSPQDMTRRVPTSATLILSQLLQSHMEPFRLMEIQNHLANSANGHPSLTIVPSSFTGVGTGTTQSSNMLDSAGFETQGRLQGESAGRYEGSRGVGDDVDPDGQIVPESLRDVVL